MDEKFRDLIFQAIDGSISPEAFDRLQDAIEQNDEVRAEYVRAVNLCETLEDIASESEASLTPRAIEAPVPQQLSISRLAVAAAVFLLVGGVAFWLGQRWQALPAARITGAESPETGPSEPMIAGHATLKRAVDLRWPQGAPTFHEGDVLPDGLLRFDDGIAEIDFFCGATLIVEGPAALDIQSDWSVTVARGRLRANVPPAARGFIVQVDGSEIIDLGTEFALEVRPENARVEVIDGEIQLRGGEHDGEHLVTGQRRWLKGTARPEAFQQLSTEIDLQRRLMDAETSRFAEWKRHSQRLSADKRLIVYYPIARSAAQRNVPNAASTRDDRDGQLIGPVGQTTGRFGAKSTALEFDRPGARVRTRIDGKFRAFTFACWARIDALEHRYNALFMGDGYENGEPHWQIRDDGRLMFSVMVDDTEDVRHFNPIEQRVVRDAGLHRVYFTEPIWDISKSGRWFHLAAVYDPVSRRVNQYVNGKQVSSEAILDKFHITTLRIGPAEIGNWGQPFRKSAWFAVRNLNGVIDELAIFDAAMTADEIHTLFEEGKPLGY